MVGVPGTLRRPAGRSAHVCIRLRVEDVGLFVRVEDTTKLLVRVGLVALSPLDLLVDAVQCLHSEMVGEQSARRLGGGALPGQRAKIGQACGSG